MSREEMPIIQTGRPTEHKTGSQTECRDEDTCVALNQFLDEGYKQPPALEFSVSADDHMLCARISILNMGPRDKAELNIRLMKFVMGEIEKIKNGN